MIRIITDGHKSRRLAEAVHKQAPIRSADHEARLNCKLQTRL